MEDSRILTEQLAHWQSTALLVEGFSQPGFTTGASQLGDPSLAKGSRLVSKETPAEGA